MFCGRFSEGNNNAENSSQASCANKTHAMRAKHIPTYPAPLWEDARAVAVGRGERRGGGVSHPRSRARSAGWRVTSFRGEVCQTVCVQQRCRGPESAAPRARRSNFPWWSGGARARARAALRWQNPKSDDVK